MALDILIKNGWIIDGLGTPKFQADIGIAKDKISKIGILGNPSAKTIVDATGLYVSPGFIDINNSSDRYLTLFSHPYMESLITQGITTIIGGNCGSSLCPLVDTQTITSVQKWGNIDQAHTNWLTLEEFLNYLKKRGLIMNFGTFVGHSTLRRGIVKDEFRALDEKELKVQNELLNRSLKEGGFGLSFGLSYSHARVAPKVEINNLASVVKTSNKIVSIHLRDEGKDLVSAVQEALDIAKTHQVPIEISHFKAIGRESKLEFTRALEMIEKASQEDIDVNFDIYPYDFTATVLYTLLPEWIAVGGRTKLLENLRQPDLRQKAAEQMQASGFDYSRLIIAAGHLDKILIGKNLNDIALNLGISIYEAIMDILLAAEGRVIVFWSSVDETNIETALKSPLSIIASDGWVQSINDARSGYLVHPRSFGTFPRILARYVKEKNILSWEEAIKKMTALPALKLGILDRGILKKGLKADIVIFDPEAIEDRATAHNPYQYSTGIKNVIVNGQIVFAENEIKPILSGEIIKK